MVRLFYYFSYLTLGKSNYNLRYPFSCLFFFKFLAMVSTWWAEEKVEKKYPEECMENVLPVYFVLILMRRS